MSRQFWTQTCYEDAFDEHHVADMVKLSFDCNCLSVLELRNQVEGFIAGVAIPLLGNGAVVQVTEMAYWINPEHRGRFGVQLMQALEERARAVGAKYLNMIAMDSSAPETAVRIYERMGYQRIESTYLKRLRD